jgi:subtilisin family serine protease
VTGIEKRKFATAVFLSIFGAASLSGVDISPDYRKIEPILLATDDPAVVAAQRRLMETPGRPDLPVPVFIHMKSDDPDLPERLGNLGGNGRRITSRLYTGRIPRDAARYISNWPQVSYIEGAKRTRPLLDLSRPAVSADNVQAGTGLPSPFDTGITGAGMYVGVVDTGLDNSHLDFHTGGTGSPQRVVHWYPDPVWASSDSDGHGTHVTGIAAGNGFMSSGTYTGMAPGAEILFGKTSFLTTDVITAVQDLVSFAETNSKPIPVNLSLGLMVGPHDGTSGFESGIDSLAAGSPGSKRLIAVAAGNETGENEHFQATLGPFGTTTASIIFENVSSAYVELWADGSDQYTVTATLGSDTVTVPHGSYASSLPARLIYVSNGRVAQPNGATLIFIAFSPPGAGSTATILLNRMRNGGTGRVDGYIDYWDGAFASATDSGTISEPANGSSVIAVGSFNTKTSGGSASSQGISYFSSLGPTRDGRLKPDVTAPGSYIYSAKSFDATWSHSYLIPGNSDYVTMQGTSMATPHITGIAALVWQSNPALTGAQMRERIRMTANAPTDGSTPPNTTWGYGKANALKAVSNSVAAITAPATALPGASVSLTSENSSAAFPGNSLTYAWSLVSRPVGSGASLGSTSASTAFTPDVSGNYTVGLTVSQTTPSGAPAGSATATIHVNNIPGVPSITGPAFYENLSPASFHGSGSDPDGQSLTFRWVLVSRPAGSSALSASPYFTANGDNVVLTPDAAGAYVVGLKVDDGLDNSVLAFHTFNASWSPPSSGGGGGGGCNITYAARDEGSPAAIVTVILLLSPAGILAARRKALRLRGSPFGCAASEGDSAGPHIACAFRASFRYVAVIMKWCTSF